MPFRRNYTFIKDKKFMTTVMNPPDRVGNIIVSKFIEKSLCKWFGHYRKMAPMMGKFAPRYCYRCGLHIKYW